MMRYFDFANHEYVKKIVRMYFDKGYPYEPHLSAITVDLSDLRIMRNASAHISSSTQVTLEGFGAADFPATGSRDNSLPNAHNVASKCGDWSNGL